MEQNDRLYEERDNFMLSCIVDYGFMAMPQDYVFLKKYSLLNIYFQIIANSTAGRTIQHLEEAAKSQASLQVNTDCKLMYYINIMWKMVEKQLSPCLVLIRYIGNVF